MSMYGSMGILGVKRNEKFQMLTVTNTNDDSRDKNDDIQDKNDDNRGKSHERLLNLKSNQVSLSQGEKTVPL